MLGSYAAHDDRKNFDQEKKACIEFPASCRQERQIQDLHGTPTPIAEATSAIAEGIAMPCVLF